MDGSGPVSSNVPAELRQVEMRVDPRFRLRQLRLAGAATPVVERFDSIHWDTADYRLATWEAGLRHRRGRGWRVTLLTDADPAGARRVDLDLPGEPGAPPAEAVRLLSGYLRGAALGPVARLRHLESHVCVREVRVLHQVVSRIEGRRAAASARRVSLRVRDRAVDTRRPLAALRRAGVSDTPDGPLLSELIGPEAAPGWRSAHLDRSSSVPAAVSAVLRAYAAALVRHQALVLEGSDPEGVHQARVACRRIRSALQTFAPLLDPGWAAGLRREIASLAEDLGRVRDAEVLLARLQADAVRWGLSPAIADRLLGGLVREREAARITLLRRVESGEHWEHVERLLAAACDPVVLVEAARQPAADALMPLVAASWRRLRRRVRRLPELPADLELHRARILAKRCRYAVMALAPLLDEGPARTGALLGALQDALGEQHDAVVAAEWLERRADPDTAFAAGVLFGAERALADRGRSAWRKPWQAVDRREAWRWLR